MLFLLFPIVVSLHQQLYAYVDSFILVLSDIDLL